MLLLLLACTPQPVVDAASPAAIDPAVFSALQVQPSVDVLVQLQPDLADGIRPRVADRMHRSQRFEHLPVMAVELSSLTDLALLNRTAGVLRVDIDPVFKAHALPDRDNEADVLMGTPAAHLRGLKGQGVSVAVIDTGVDYTHEDFGACSAPGEAGCAVVASVDIAPEDGQLDGASGHGTNVAGIVHQVALKSGIVALDVFDGNSASGSDVLAALEWVLEHQDEHDIVAVNMSLGGGQYDDTCDDNAFAAAVEDAVDAGIQVVISSGNDGWTDSTSFPGCVSAAITVGAVYDNDLGARSWSTCSDAVTESDVVTCFSNDADHVDLLAPGAMITAADLSMGGTSQASPHVAGAIAVLVAAWPDKDRSEVLTHIQDSGVSVTDPRSGRTHARIDLDAATDVPDPDTGDTGAGDTGDTGTEDTGSEDTGTEDTGTGDTGDTGYEEDPQAWVNEDWFTPGSVSATASTNRTHVSWTGFEAVDGISHYLLVRNVGGPTSDGCTNVMDTRVYKGDDTFAPDDEDGNGKIISYRVCAVDTAGRISDGVTTTITHSDALPEELPVGTVVINGNDLESESLRVKVRVTASDAAVEMCVSELPICTDWQATETHFAWNFSPMVGERSLWVVFRDEDGNISPPVRDTITITSLTDAGAHPNP